MNDNLMECIEELQKCREKLITIREDMIKEKTNFIEELELEFPQYTAPKRRNTAIRHNLANRNSRIEDKIRKFEEKIKLMSKEATKVYNRIYSLGWAPVSVRLGDLIDELVNLTGIDMSNVMINANVIQLLSLPGNRSEEVSKSLNTTYGNFRFNHGILISGKGMSSGSLLFCYLIHLNSMLSDVQADGKTLLEHCTVDVEYDMVDKNICTSLNIKDNIDDLILRIPLSKLASDSNAGWYPADLMIQAIINCVEKSQEKEVSKKRSRKLSDETSK